MQTRRWLCMVAFVGATAGCKERAVTPAVDAGTDAATSCGAFATEHEALLNAPTDATVVRKQVVLPALPGGDVPRPLPAPIDAPDGGP